MMSYKLFNPIVRLKGGSTSLMECFNCGKSHSCYFSSYLPENNETKRRFIRVEKNEQQKLAKKRPDQPANAERLQVAIIGAPNAGKSTLANRLVGHRFASVSSKVHTTRESTIGAFTEGNKQVVLLDTPGIIHPQKKKQHKMERTLVIDPHSSIFLADIIAVIVDVSTAWGRNQMDREVLKALYIHRHKRSILILNKVDVLKDKEQLFKATRLLTEGVVAGKRESEKASQVKEDKFDVNLLFERMNPNANIPSKQHVNEVVLGMENHEEKEDNVCDFIQNRTVPDLWSSQEWHQYHNQLRKASRAIYDKKGWPYFSSVFMISAIHGDGIDNLKNHLLKSTVVGNWSYNSQFVTNQHPVEMAKMCIREKLLDCLPNEIPYKVKVVTTLWEINEDGLLSAAFAIVCNTQREVKYIIGRNGETIGKISRYAKQDLMNTFRTEMSLKLIAKLKSDKHA